MCSGSTLASNESYVLQSVIEAYRRGLYIIIHCTCRRLCSTEHKRRGMPGLSLQVQQALGRDPHAGDLYVFRGRKGDFLKVLWHDGLGLSLYAKRLERGRFLWPSPADGVVSISAAQLGYLLEGIDWRHPQRTWRPAAAG